MAKKYINNIKCFVRNSNDRKLNGICLYPYTITKDGIKYIVFKYYFFLGGAHNWTGSDFSGRAVDFALIYCRF